jgi:hypothetical protein
LAFSTIAFHLRRSSTFSVGLLPAFSIVITFQVPVYIVSFLIRLARIGCLRFISLSFLCWDFLACRFLQDEVAGLVLNPRYLGGPRIFCRGCLP